MKYIVLNSNGIEVAILFPDAVAHSQAVNQAQGKPIAAGFCYVQNGRWIAYGGSDSLQIKSRGLLDAEAIQLTFDLAGIATIAWKDTDPNKPAFSSAHVCGKCGSDLEPSVFETPQGLLCPNCTAFSHHANSNSFAEFGVSHHPATTNAHPSTE